MKLVVKKGRGAGQEFRLTRGRTTIGRGPGNTVVLSDVKVSGRHAVIERQDGDYIITDLQSTNHTFVNEKQIDAPYPLRLGDEVRVGNTVLQLQAAPVAERRVRPLVMVLAGAAVLLIIAAVLFLPSRDRRRIAFVSDRDGNDEIYVMEADGGGLNRLTSNEATDWLPAWSPDGRQIVYASDQGVGFDIYVMDSDGRNQKFLTALPSNNFCPSWSKADKLAFASDQEVDSEIYVMPAGGGAPIKLTDNEANEFEPAWSPDGQWIAFASDIDGDFEIYVMPASGGGWLKRTDNSVDDRGPTWSPDGQMIAFYANREGEVNTDIYVMTADGGSRTPLLVHPADDLEPTWSPDGRRLAFSSDRDGDYEIYVMNFDGTGLRNVTNNSAADRYPSWLR